MECEGDGSADIITKWELYGLFFFLFFFIFFYFFFLMIRRPPRSTLFPSRRSSDLGDADQRLREDYLRILRFFRFNAWYGAGIDAEGLDRKSTRLNSSH